jgi:TIR domain
VKAAWGRHGSVPRRHSLGDPLRSASRARIISGHICRRGADHREDGRVADIFVSYTSSDRDWAFWIAKQLEPLGHTPHIHEWEIKSGDDIYAWMERRHDAANHVLCVVSDEYLKAPYSTLERNAALWQAASKRPGFVLLVAVKPCRLPTLSDHIRRCELFGMPEEAASVRFQEFMAKRTTPATVAFPGNVFAVSNIPIRKPTHFMGRDDALATIETALNRHEGRVAITALHGAWRRKDHACRGVRRAPSR